MHSAHFFLNSANWSVALSNEEAYFAIAAHWFGITDFPRDSSVLGGMPHMAVFSEVMGGLINLIGFEFSQVISRLVVIGVYVFALLQLVRRIGLSAIDIVWVLASFLLVGEGILGEEWLFRGTEPKSFAYPCVLLGLSYSLGGKHILSALLFALATYFHLLVGGYAWLFTAAAVLLLDRNARTLFKPSLVYGIAILPLSIMLLINGYLNIYVIPKSEHSAAWIATFLRNPHHVMPFFNAATFYQWVPGFAFIAFIAVGVWWGTQPATRNEKMLAMITLVIAWFSLVTAAILAIDSSAALGPFFPFRPTSLALFCLLLLVASRLRRYLENEGRNLRMLLALALLALTVPAVAHENLSYAKHSRSDAQMLAKFFETIRGISGTEDRFLITSDVEERLLSFERRTGRPAYVMFKFFPSTNDKIFVWYDRLRVRERVEREGCQSGDFSRFQFVVADEMPSSALDRCGTVVWHGEGLILIQIDPSRI